MDLLRKGGTIIPISPVSSTPCHLLYTDNIMLFIKAKKLKDMLKLYQDSSGQCFNLQKVIFIWARVMPEGLIWQPNSSKSKLLPCLWSISKFPYFLDQLGTSTSIRYWTPSGKSLQARRQVSLFYRQTDPGKACIIFNPSKYLSCSCSSQ